MNRFVFIPLVVLIFCTFSLSFSQLNCMLKASAGMYTNMDYVQVNQTLIGQNHDSLYLDLNDDDTYDLLFTASYYNWGIGLNSSTLVSLLHQHVELSADTVYATRLAYGDSIGDCLFWKTYTFVPSNITLGTIAVEPGYLVYGNYLNYSGYLGYRILSSTDTIYGWIQINSIVTESGSQLEVIDYAKESLTTVDYHYEMDENIRLYPNPVKNFLNISGTTNPMHYNIYSYNGVILKSGTIQAGDDGISLLDLEDGVYLLELYNDYYSTRSCIVHVK